MSDPEAVGAPSNGFTSHASQDPTTDHSKKRAADFREQTPRVVKFTSNYSFWQGDLDGQRTLLANDYPELPEVTVDFMFQHCLPQVVTSERLAATVEKLKDSKWITTTGKMKGYTDKTPSQDSRHETAAFRSLSLFIDEVLEMDSERSTSPLSQLTQHYTQVEAQGEAASSSRNDSYNVVEKEGHNYGPGYKLNSADVISIREDKKKNDAKNRAQVCRFFLFEHFGCRNVDNTFRMHAKCWRAATKSSATIRVVNSLMG